LDELQVRQAGPLLRLPNHKCNSSALFFCSVFLLESVSLTMCSSNCHDHLTTKWFLRTPSLVMHLFSSPRALPTRTRDALPQNFTPPPPAKPRDAHAKISRPATRQSKDRNNRFHAYSVVADDRDVNEDGVTTVAILKEKSKAMSALLPSLFEIRIFP
jgi:hypothetical protein